MESDILKKIVIPLLIFIGIIYLTNGVVTLMSASFRGDLHTRWRERNYLISGVDPYDVSVQYRGFQPTEAELARIGKHKLYNETIIDSSGYPPWGLASLLLLIPFQSFPPAQIFFVLLSLLGLGVSCCYAFFLGKRYGFFAGFLLASSVFAMFGNAGTLRLGQFGLILNALLVFSLITETKNNTISGLAIAGAAIKPNYSLLYIIAKIPRQQWACLVFVGTLCALASLIPWALTGVDPIQMIEQMVYQSSHVTQGDVGLLGLLRNFIPYSYAITSLSILGIITTLLLGLKYRNASPLVIFSVVSVLGRLCFYHRQYDNVMLAFPLMALGLLALIVRKRWAWLVFVVFGTSLWIPIPYAAYTPPIVIFLSVVWIVGAATICRNSHLL